MQVKKAIFLDKDGTLIPNIPYNVDPDKIHLESGVVEGLKLLVQQGFDLYVVTNQSGIAKGYFSEDDIFVVRDALKQLFEINGLPPFKAFYFCPHHPNGIVSRLACTCNCRKPMPGLLQMAAFDHQLSLTHSWMIGDILNDIEAGNRAGCKSVLINNGNETLWESGPYRTPYSIASDFLNAAESIVSHLTNEQHGYGNIGYSTAI
ncbi:HAD-IIIA family hydrolase [Olivibacter ginsenosidimutans]|uniref:D,D-heptose 1,7-bisphosphate phosphatase n=1 Tax=Olivibacter ginsenosidimutans TaxID=1176537 RepID=A0ABP9BEA2_9SPHI